MRPGPVLVAAVVVAAALVGGVAYATIPGPDKVYSACMLKGVGTIRLIDKTLSSTSFMSRCTDKEMEIAWNQAGPAGLPGPKGDTGPKGEKGDPGRGLSSLDDLAGVPCHTPDFQGVVEISSTPVSVKSASIVMRCTIPNAAILTVQLEDLNDVQAAAGRVTGGPVDCELVQGGTGNQTCVYVVRLGTELTLTATPVSPDVRYESIFVGWLAPNECLVPGPCTFTVSGDRTVVALFNADSR